MQPAPDRKAVQSNSGVSGAAGFLRVLNHLGAGLAGSKNHYFYPHRARQVQVCRGLNHEIARGVGFALLFPGNLHRAALVLPPRKRGRTGRVSQYCSATDEISGQWNKNLNIGNRGAQLIDDFNALNCNAGRGVTRMFWFARASAQRQCKQACRQQPKSFHREAHTIS